MQACMENEVFGVIKEMHSSCMGIGMQRQGQLASELAAEIQILSYKIYV